MTPGTLTRRGFRLPVSATYSTCAMTSPPLFLVAIAIASVSSVNDSRSMMMLPSGSAAVPRMKATEIGIAL